MKRGQTTCLTRAFLGAELNINRSLSSPPCPSRMVNLLTLAASLKADGHSQSNKTRVTKLGSRNKLSLIAVTTPIYCFSSLSSKYFLEIFDAVCDFQNLENKHFSV